MNISEKCIELVKRFESLHDGDLNLIGLQPKMCPAGYWTEGWGRLVLDSNGNKISGIENKAKAYRYSTIKTEREAEIALLEDLEVRAKRVRSLKLPFNQSQFDALVSFVYNVGFASLLSSTLLKRMRVDVNHQDIRAQFIRWNKALINGRYQPLRGLTRRRNEEANLYLGKW